jgi:hypothetical protein
MDSLAAFVMRWRRYAGLFSRRRFSMGAVSTVGLQPAPHPNHAASEDASWLDAGRRAYRRDVAVPSQSYTHRSEPIVLCHIDNAIGVMTK